MTQIFLGVTRLSVEREESTSIAKQQEILESWAAVKGAVLVDVVIDEGVSGDTSPFDRPGLGPWLTDESVAQYDGIVGWKIDRFARNTREFLNLVDWLQARGKDIAVTDQNIDTSTPGGRMVLTIIAALAQWEREMMVDRAKGTRSFLRQKGQWGAGKGPFWTKTVTRNGRKYLELDPAKVPLVREIVDMRLADYSYVSISRHLASKGIEMEPSFLYSLCHKPALLGYSTHVPKGGNRSQRHKYIIRDSDGLPVQFCEPVVTEDEYDRLTETKKNKTSKKGLTKRYILRSLVFCGTCGGPFYYGAANKSSPYGRYRHTPNGRQKHGCPMTQVSQRQLEYMAEAVFLNSKGLAPVIEKIYVPGNDNSSELDRINRNIAGLREESDMGLYDDDREGYLSRLKRFTEAKKKLESEPVSEPYWEQIETDQTYSQVWESASAEQKNEMLSDIDFKMYIYRSGEMPIIDPPINEVSSLEPIGQDRWLNIRWRETYHLELKREHEISSSTEVG